MGLLGCYSAWCSMIGWDEPQWGLPKYDEVQIVTRWWSVERGMRGHDEMICTCLMKLSSALKTRRSSLKDTCLFLSEKSKGESETRRRISRDPKTQDTAERNWEKSDRMTTRWMFGLELPWGKTWDWLPQIDWRGQDTSKLELLLNSMSRATQLQNRSRHNM